MSTEWVFVNGRHRPLPDHVLVSSARGTMPFLKTLENPGSRASRSLVNSGTSGTLTCLVFQSGQAGGTLAVPGLATAQRSSEPGSDGVRRDRSLVFEVQ